MKKYKTWLSLALGVQLLTAVFHSLSLFAEVQPENETEKMFFGLIESYRFDLGGGYSRTYDQLTTALSACFSLLCLLGGLINWHLLRKKAAPSLIRGILNIELLVFGICFGIMLVFTFLPPIVLTGLIFLFLSASRIILPSNN